MKRKARLKIPASKKCVSTACSSTLKMTERNMRNFLSIMND